VGDEHAGFVLKKGHLVLISQHAALRLRDLWGEDHFEKIAERIDKVWPDAKRDVPAQHGAWWYSHPDVILCVDHTVDGVPFITCGAGIGTGQ
jgi:hypothetical protein